MNRRVPLLLALAVVLALAGLAVRAGSQPAPTAGPTTKKPSEAELRQRLTPEQYSATQQAGTEPPFRNAYWNNHEPGIYVDIVSGEPLFSSLDKYDSGTVWPSFSKPLEPANVATRDDSAHGMQRT